MLSGLNEDELKKNPDKPDENPEPFISDNQS
jgi:hypothetical protein